RVTTPPSSLLPLHHPATPSPPLCTPPPPDPLPILQRLRQPRAGIRQELRLRLERAGDHPDEREQHEDRDHGEYRVEHNLANRRRSEEHTSELQSRENLVCRLLLEKKTPSHAVSSAP